jgi:hypothetical protein
MMLVETRPKALSKAELQERLWPATFVVEANLSNLVAEIREALGDRGRSHIFIRTVHGFGYAFCGDATPRQASDAPSAGRQVCCLEWGDKRYPLAAGEHIIGRDPDIAVRLDGSTVSRRHARLVVTSGETVLEDLGSKNGTFLGADRVTSAVPLADGDTIRIGSVLVTFHTLGLMSTVTLSRVVP